MDRKMNNKELTNTEALESQDLPEIITESNPDIFENELPDEN